jgi:hypothetical protein
VYSCIDANIWMLSQNTHRWQWVSHCAPVHMRPFDCHVVTLAYGKNSSTTVMLDAAGAVYVQHVHARARVLTTELETLLG